MFSIPCIVSHGITEKSGLKLFPKSPLSFCRYEKYFQIIYNEGFTPITYDELLQIFFGRLKVCKPLLLDFDHPAKSIFQEIFPLLEKFGFRANLFLNTQVLVNQSTCRYTPLMSWNHIRKLCEAGWSVGNHTHSHPNFSKVSRDQIIEELVMCSSYIKKELGVQPITFAYTGNSWSKIAEVEISQRFEFSRLWITHYGFGSNSQVLNKWDDNYSRKDFNCADDKFYYLEKTNQRYRIPGYELQDLIYEYSDFKIFLKGVVNVEY